MNGQSAGEVRVQLDGGGGVLVSVVGEFDRALHDSFVKAGERGTKVVVVDLSETTFLDSGGMRALVTGRNDALRRGAELRISRASDVARASLEITGLAEPMGLGAPDGLSVDPGDEGFADRPAVGTS